MRLDDRVRATLMHATARWTVRYGDDLRFAGSDLPAPERIRVPTRFGHVPAHVYRDPPSTWPRSPSPAPGWSRRGCAGWCAASTSPTRRAAASPTPPPCSPPTSRTCRPRSCSPPSATRCGSRATSTWRGCATRASGSSTTPPRTRTTTSCPTTWSGPRAPWRWWPGRSSSTPPTPSAGVDQGVHLEVHRVGVVPVAAPGEAPLLEDRHDRPVHLADGAALVAGHVEVERQPERVVGQRGGAGDEARVVAAGVLAGVELVGQPALHDLVQRGGQLREDQLVAGDAAQDRHRPGRDVRGHPPRVRRDPAAA